MDLFQKDASLIFRICWRMIKAGSMKQLGEKLRIMRKMRELTQGDVAEFLHIDRSTYTYYELGKTDPPLESIIALSDYFEISLDDLLRHRSSLETFQILYHRKLIKMSCQNLKKDYNLCIRKGKGDKQNI